MRAPDLASEIFRPPQGTESGLTPSNPISATDRYGGDVSTPAGTTALHADFDAMHAIAAAIDAGNGEIRGMLQGFVGRIRAVPPSVWSGLAAVRFHEVLDRWNTEALNLHHALARIAETIRGNERVLRDVAEAHSHRIAAAGDGV